jgi:hypothetical protein
VGRWHELVLVFAAALGLAGCLLFSDPVNKAPTVTVSTPASPIYRDTTVEFAATVKDDRDSPSDLQLRWHVFPTTEQSCLWISSGDWPRGGIQSAPTDQPFPYKFDSVDTMNCVCAQVTDSKGAQGYGCSQAIRAATPVPVAVIKDESGLLSGQARRLCSQIKLSAEDSKFPTGDLVQYRWSLQSAGRPVPLSNCPDDNTAVHQCFYAAAPGTYTASLTIDDLLDKNNPTSGTSPDFVIPVGVDTPPCIRRTDPEARSQLILLDQSRLFKAVSVDDDCEPFPMVSGSTGATQFVWSVLDNTSSDASGWVRQTDSSESFTVSQAKFPNARPGDMVKIRLEVRDTPVQQMYQAGVTVCSTATETCCGPTGCTGGANDCVRWTTWTVQFQP